MAVVRIDWNKKERGQVMGLSKMEFEGYKAIIESKETKDTMLGPSPDDISKLGAEMAVYYARLSGELAIAKDTIDEEYLRLVKPIEEGGEGMKVTAADRVAEVNVNAKNEVSRRGIEQLMAAIDKIGFAASSRVQSFKKEGNY
jgi:hypothetical protein